jgi:hypothetical protein
MGVRVVRVLAAALVIGGSLTAPVQRASAEAGKFESFDVDVGPVSERDGRVVLTITSGCEGDIPYQFWTGRRAPSGATDVSQNSFDARGSAATSGADYVEQSGSFTLSKVNRVTIEVPLVDNSAAEGLEHVVILFESPVHAGVIAGDTYRCTANAADPNRTYIESAFTIVDDDPASTAGSGSAVAGPSGSSRPARPGTGGATPTTTAERASSAVTSSSLVATDDEFERAAGVKLVGAALKPEGRQHSGSLLPALAAAALLGLVAAGSWFRWRRTW